MKKHFKQIAALLLALSLTVTALAGCVKPSDKKPVVLMVSFGTSYNDNRDLSVGGMENAVQAAYPGYEVRRAFTSQIIIDKLKERDNITIDNVKEAMDRLVADGVKEVIIQPTHVMSGYEYDDVAEEVRKYIDKFDSFKIGKTLLAADADYDEVAGIITEATKDYDVEGTAVVFMGHGTEHTANETYAKLQAKLTAAGKTNYFIGTVEAEPSLEDVIGLVKESGATKVVLLPLMVVAGDHANNDMAGDEEDSWKSEFTREGFEVECVLKGLGQYEGIQALIVKHLADTIAAPAELYGSQIKDGTYDIKVESSSSMFRIVDCKLTVEGGKMSAVITLSGTGFEKLYMGTGEQAESDEPNHIEIFETNDGQNSFVVPVEALNKELDCAGLSARKQTWSDHKIVFKSDLISKDDISE